MPRILPWQGKRVVTIAYTQEKRVAGELFRSPQDGFWDRKVCRNFAVASPPHMHRNKCRASLAGFIDPEFLLYH